MLDAIRVTLTAYTASFRVPSLVGHQLTLTVPPLSTIYGLLSAAAGRWALPEAVAWLAYRCAYATKATDLEAIRTVERSQLQATPRFVQRDVIVREFLSLPRLTLYLPPEWEARFRRPRYALLLGRTQDIGAVEAIVSVKLEPWDSGEVNGVLLPLELVLQNHAHAWLHNLPIALSNEPQRRLLGVRRFGVVDAQQRPAKVRSPEWLVRDTTDGTVVPLYRREWVCNAIGHPVSQVG
jgi:CRISPR-associated protein Cas5t